MGKKPSLSPTKRVQIVTLRGEGYSERQLAAKFKCSKTAVHQALARYQETSTYRDKQRSGRPRVTSARDDSLMKRMVIRSPSSSLSKIKAALGQAGTAVSGSTVSRRLSNEFGLKSRKPAAKPRLTPVMKQKRLDFAQKYKDWTIADWSKVLFSDESTLVQFNTRKRQIRRPVGKRYDERYTVMTMKHPPSQMVWGAMSAMGTSGLFFLEKNTTMNGEKYKKLLQDKLILHMRVHQCSVFMHDGAPCHRSRTVKDFLNQANVTVLDWPGNSPDLNPIENLWTVLKDKVADKQPACLESMIAAIKATWVLEITPTYCRTLIESMPRRLMAVIKNKGGHTKY